MKYKGLINTASAIIAVNALAAAHAQAAEPQPLDFLAADENEQTRQQVQNLFQKRVMANAVQSSYLHIMRCYKATGDQSLQRYFFGDLLDHLQLTAQSEGATGVDSTDLWGRSSPDASLRTCHRQCHHQCHGSRGWR